MYRVMLACSVAVLASIGIPALAQGVDDLPDRPIARSEVIAVVKHQFSTMDTNHDGYVSQAEFDRYRASTENSAAASSSGLAAFDHLGRHWFERADSKGEGRVTLPEAEAHPLQLFDLADTNHDGIVSPSERQVASLLMSLGGH